MTKSKKLAFLELKVRDPSDLNDYLDLFLKEWRKFYPDQLRTHIENIAYSRKISKLEAIKILEDEITSQFKHLIDTFQSFPDPFKIYSFWEITNVNEFLNNFKENMLPLSQGWFPEFWAWSKDSLFPPNDENSNQEYAIIGLIFKNNVNWALTLLKNCELAYGLDEKEVVLLPNKEIQIIKIEGRNFIREFPMKKS